VVPLQDGEDQHADANNGDGVDQHQQSSCRYLQLMAGGMR
jgi:hypothetical protein